MKKIFLITAAILTSMGLALFVGAFMASGFEVSKLDITHYETNTYPVNADFNKIEINTKETDIVFTPAAEDGVKVVCVERENVKHSVSVENGTLEIAETDTRKWYDHITLFAKSTSVTVYLPSDKLESLVINNDTGDVSVPASFTFGNAGVKASAGDIAFKASVDGLLKIITSTGNITLSGVNAGQLELSASTGDIMIKSLACRENASIKADTGDTRINNMTCRNFFTTGNTGDITLKNTVASDSFSIRRDTGDVNFDNADAEQITVRTSTGDVSGTLRTEKIFISHTSTGSIHVPDTVSGGKCEITTSTGDIDIRLK